MNKIKVGYFLTGIAATSFFSKPLPDINSEFFKVNNITTEEELLYFFSIKEKGRNFYFLTTILVMVCLALSAIFLPQGNFVVDFLLLLFILIKIMETYFTIKYNDMIKNNKKMIY